MPSGTKLDEFMLKVAEVKEPQSCGLVHPVGGGLNQLVDARVFKLDQENWQTLESTVESTARCLRVASPPEDASQKAPMLTPWRPTVSSNYPGSATVPPSSISGGTSPGATGVDSGVTSGYSSRGDPWTSG